MLNATVPKPSATRRRRDCPPVLKARQVSMKLGRWRFERRAGRVARFLFPKCDGVQHHGRERRALHDLNQLQLGEIRQHRAEQQRARDHAEQQHDAKQRHDLGMRLRQREVGRQRQADRLRRVQPGADHEERQRRRRLADPGSGVAIAGQQNERERHDGQPAELHQRAHPQIRHAAPAQYGPMGVRLIADDGPERREHQRQGDHGRHQPGRHAQFDDHHPVQRADQQHDRHADGDLEQRQAQQPAHREPD